jgi:Spx/MgsR family transcriptional regulator
MTAPAEGAPMTTTMYGIPNCDTVKKARAFLAGRSVEVVFHDYKRQGVPDAELDRWLARVGWERLLNRRGPTWRKLDPALQATVHDAASAKAVMLAHSSVIKRPVLTHGDQVIVGFDEPQWSALFG